MAQYFFKMSQSERNNILDQHKTIYDGYVTQYGQQSNTQPLYVQDFANDKVGLTVSNKGVVKPYTNMGINESHTGLDMIGGDSHDQSEMKYRHLENGTVDIDSIMNMLDSGVESFGDEYPSPNENEVDYVSLGNDEDECDECDDDNLDIVIGIDSDYNNMGQVFEDDVVDSVETYEYDIDEPKGFESQSMNFDSELEEDDLPNFVEKLNESLDMFKRFKKYN
jgi:hypothetical protein